MSAVDPTQEVIRVGLNQEQIKNSPSWDADQPVSRQFERDYYAHYGWPIYWGGPYAWGMSQSPALRGHTPGTLADACRAEEENNDPHLRSTKNVTKHYIQAAGTGSSPGEFSIMSPNLESRGMRNRFEQPKHGPAGRGSPRQNATPGGKT